MLLTLAIAFVGYVACLYTYRLILHPLAKYPGPKLAAVSRWYECYYDVVLKGQFVFHLPELHKKYVHCISGCTAQIEIWTLLIHGKGPIIRISPDELHIDDPEFFDTLYAKSGRLHKSARDEDRFGNPNSVFVTANANTHRVRRAALNPFFSKRNVNAFQDVIQDKVGQMLRNIAAYRGTGKPLAINLAYMAMLGDIVMQYCFGYDYDHVNSPNFETNFHELVVTASQSGAVAVHFPIMMKILLAMPEWFVVWSTPLFALLFKLHKSVAQDVKKWRKLETDESSAGGGERTNVIQHLMRSDMPAAEKTDQRLQDEGTNFIGAGVSTTGWTLAVATFHIINNKGIYAKLRKELEDIVPDAQAADALDEVKLEKCEYLTACIKEAIRLSYAVSTRLIRISDTVIQYDRWDIPPNTAIGMSIPHISHNEDIFPDSQTYNPERWLKDVKTMSGESIEKYWVGFGRGSRSCLGINLAWSVLYVSLGGVFRNFEFGLFETDVSDVELKHDFMVPSPKLDSKGIRVLVKE